MILVYGLSDHPMVLATNLSTDSKNLAIAAMRHYFSRWRIEEYFRFKKQMFDFENFRVRSLTAINSLNFFLSACMLFLATVREKSDRNMLFRICVEAAAPLCPTLREKRCADYSGKSTNSCYNEVSFLENRDTEKGGSAMSELHGYVNRVNEKDWKLFRSRLPGWQEAFMEKLIGEYTEILHGDGFASDKFWALEERLRQDKRNPGVLITEMSRSRMRANLLQLLSSEVITADDLVGFSDELREDLSWVTRNWGAEPDVK